MQRRTTSKVISPIPAQPIFAALHDRVHELPENFFDFVQSECNMTADKYALYLMYPEKCPPEEMQIMLKVAGHLAHDLKALISQCKRAIAEP
jgi:hypothetical protein